jgi:hypothetical protein
MDLEVPLNTPAKPAAPAARGSAKGRRGDTGQSWWTARATTGEVKAGFTKAEILRKPESDPRAEGGMFDRLQGLLRELGA